jgi:hypothetical protein
METNRTIKNGHIDTKQQGVRGEIASVNQLFGLTARLAPNGPEQVPDRLNATVPAALLAAAGRQGLGEGRDVAESAEKATEQVARQSIRKRLAGIVARDVGPPGLEADVEEYAGAAGSGPWARCACGRAGD